MNTTQKDKSYSVRWLVIIVLGICAGTTLHGRPNCKRRTTMKELKHIRHDLKTVTPPCPCPCERYRQSYKYGRCSHCGHFVELPDPYRMYQATGKICMPRRFGKYQVPEQNL